MKNVADNLKLLSMSQFLKLVISSDCSTSPICAASVVVSLAAESFPIVVVLPSGKWTPTKDFARSRPSELFLCLKELNEKCAANNTEIK